MALMVKPKFTLLKYQLSSGKVPFDIWFGALGETTQARIDTRLDRLCQQKATQPI